MRDPIIAARINRMDLDALKRKYSNASNSRILNELVSDAVKDDEKIKLAKEKYDCLSKKILKISKELNELCKIISKEVK